MKLSEINSFLINSISAKDLSILINGEIEQYKKNLSVKGKSTPIILIEDISIIFGNDNLNKLCRAFINNELNKWEVSYIADALSLSGKVTFVSTECQNLLECLADPEINGLISTETAQEILFKIAKL